MKDLLKKLEEDQSSFAFVEAEGNYYLYLGTPRYLQSIDDVSSLYQETGKQVFFALPFHVIKEKGCEALGGEPVLALAIDQIIPLNKEDFDAVSSSIIKVAGDITTSLSDQKFEALVKQLQQEHIAQGDATQIVLSRSFKGCFEDLSLAHLVNLFYRMSKTGGQYKTVFFAHKMNDHDPHYLLAATPECHLAIDAENATMMPIAGTFRKWGYQKSLKEDLIDFLSDPKEINELFQVVDEEVKMMGTICPDGGRIEGPFLREVGAVIHTEYKLKGKKGISALQALRRSCHAPTLVGGPLESAARIIARYEEESRRYYGGEIGVYDGATDCLDCSIFIRGIEIFKDKTFCVQAGAGVVRDSDPESEMKETLAKAQGVLNILAGQEARFAPVLDEALKQELTPVLEQRNKNLSHFWCQQQTPIKPSQLLKGLKITIINNEDDFAYMVAHLLKYQGCHVHVVDTFDYDKDKHKAVITLIGPGPGDVNDLKNPRMARLNKIVSHLFAQNALMMGVCLGHQAIAKYLGLDVTLQDQNTQGVQAIVPVFGRNYALGFYNSFSPIKSKIDRRVSFDCDEQGRVLAMQGDHFMGVQFHPESILSEKGHEILVESLMKLRLTRGG